MFSKHAKSNRNISGSLGKLRLVEQGGALTIERFSRPRSVSVNEIACWHPSFPLRLQFQQFDRAVVPATCQKSVASDE